MQKPRSKKSAKGKRPAINISVVPKKVRSTISNDDEFDFDEDVVANLKEVVFDDAKVCIAFILRLL